MAKIYPPVVAVRNFKNKRAKWHLVRPGLNSLVCNVWLPEEQRQTQEIRHLHSSSLCQNCFAAFTVED